MRNSTHNELALKKQLQPKDYVADDTIRIIKPKSDIVMPVDIFEEARRRGLI